MLTPGQHHEATACARLLEQGAVRRPARVVDARCRRRGSCHTSPRLRTARRGSPGDRAACRLRHRVARLSNPGTQCRSLAARDDQRAETYRARWVLAMIILRISDAL